jgi:hypothetical protein
MSGTDLGVIATGEQFPGLDFDGSGNLFAFSTGSSGNIYNIQNFAASGAGTLVASSGVQHAGVTLSAIPEPSASLMLGIVVIPIGGFTYLRRAHRNTEIV